MVAFTRTALDANVNPEDLIVSFGAFTDPVRGYSELRVAFALPSAPDELINGVPIPLPVGALCPLLVAEPDSMDRLYNSIHNLQRPLIKPDSTPKPSIPSMLLN